MASGADTRRRRFFDDRSPYVDRFGWLLGLAIAAVVALSLVELAGGPAETTTWSTVATTALVGATLSLALRASGTSRLWQRVVDAILVLGVVTVLVIALASSAGAATAPVAAPVAQVLVAALAPAVVIRRLLRHRRVSSGTLLGAISAYVLIALAFFYAFLATEQHLETPFFGEVESTTSFMYFSLSTITTLGYGDLAARTDVGRLLATSEAVVGQVYLVTFVAMIVGLLAQEWSAPRHNDEIGA